MLLCDILPGLNTALALLVLSGASLALARETRANPVIVVSVDTLRADRVTCYGNSRVSTSSVDALSGGGTRFTQAGSQVPLTFPSHFCIFTSTFPYSNGIQENVPGRASSLVTLATILKARGYTTAAFVGGFPLDARFGLNQGFDYYDGNFQSDGGPLRGEGFRRPGEEVARAAMEWLDKHSDGPFFLFVHLYDLHTPYNLTPDQQARYGGNTYDAELKYVDETLGKFWAYLESKGLLDKSLIVFLSDHGEGLMDHGEPDHGYLLYQTTLHVPLIFHWPRSAEIGNWKSETGQGIRTNGTAIHFCRQNCRRRFTMRRANVKEWEHTPPKN